MKYMKMLGLAAIAAAALMAVADSASATQLTSPTGTALPAGTVIKSELKEGVAKLAANFGNIECKESVNEDKTTNGGSSTETVRLIVTRWTFTNCNGGACTVVALRNGELEIHSISGTENGTVTGWGQEWTTNCSFFGINYHCIWSTGTSTSPTHMGVLTGGAPAVLDLHATLIRIGGTSGTACGSTGTFFGTLKVTSPNPLYVS
jgi:hypothetical protein